MLNSWRGLNTIFSWEVQTQVEGYYMVHLLTASTIAAVVPATALTLAAMFSKFNGLYTLKVLGFEIAIDRRPAC
ncbi:MAG: hypothetical protein WBB28_05790 [Crinalium sp.]